MQYCAAVQMSIELGLFPTDLVCSARRRWGAGAACAARLTAGSEFTRNRRARPTPAPVNRGTRRCSGPTESKQANRNRPADVDTLETARSTVRRYADRPTRVLERVVTKSPALDKPALTVDSAASGTSEQIDQNQTPAHSDGRAGSAGIVHGISLHDTREAPWGTGFGLVSSGTIGDLLG